MFQEMIFMILDVLTLFRTLCCLANTLPNPTLISPFRTSMILQHQTSHMTSLAWFRIYRRDYAFLILQLEI